MRKSLLIVSLFFVSFGWVAEAYKVTKKIIYRQTIIRKGPNPTTKPLGVLPRGTVARVSEKEENDYVLVEVELEDGKVRGWIPTSHLKRATWQTPVDETEKREIAEAQEKKEKAEEDEDGSIPLDEGVLMKRDSSFVYGFSLMPNYSVQSSELANADYVGISFGAAANLGVFIDKRFIFEGEVQYQKMTGLDENDNNLDLGYAGVGVNLRYFPYMQFEVMGGISYWRGISLGIIPTGMSDLTDASDASTLVGNIGVGYRFKISDVGFLVTKFRFQPSFSQAPVSFSLFNLQIGLEFNG